MLALSSHLLDFAQLEPAPWAAALPGVCKRPRQAHSARQPNAASPGSHWQEACSLTPLPLLAFPEVPAHATATPPLRSHAPASEMLGSCGEGRQWHVDERTDKGPRVGPRDSPELWLSLVSLVEIVIFLVTEFQSSFCLQKRVLI